MESKSSKSNSSSSVSNSKSRARSSRARVQTLSVAEIGEQLMDQLPDKLREDIDMLMEESDHTIRGARDYIRENPREALGLAVGVGALAWTIFGTSPGRKVAQWGAMMAMPYVTGWIAERFDRGEVGDMQADEEGERSTRSGRTIKTAQADDAIETEGEHRH